MDTNKVKNNNSKPSFVSSAPTATKKKKTFTLNTKSSIIISVIVCVYFVLLAAHYLIKENSEVLFMAQSKSFFTTSCIFFKECMSLPGGLITWIASYLTQYFYEPVTGSIIIISIWTASLIISKFAFKVKAAWMAVLSIPLVCLLVGVIDTEYWIYYIKQEGHYFYGTVGYFFCMVLVFIGTLSDNKIYRPVMTAVAALTYPLFALYSLIAAVYIAIITVVEQIKAKSNIINILASPIIAVILFIVLPLICMNFIYPEMNDARTWAVGIPRFENDNIVSTHPLIPYYILYTVPILFALFIGKEKLNTTKSLLSICLTIAIGIGAFMWVSESNYTDYNYKAEMRMYRAADEQDWDKALQEMAGIPGDASRQMVLIKNIALLNKRQMGEKLFAYNNMGATPKNSYDTLHVHMVQTASPLIYFYHGKTNFAVRWCIENSVEFGYDFDNLKNLTRCAIINGEMDCAKKYLDILKTTIYYKEWAERLYPLTEKPSLLSEYHEFDSVKELHSNMGSVLDGDNGLCEMYLLNYFSNTINKDSELLQELTLNYAMIQKDIKLFWPRFFLFAREHPSMKMPRHYQEAAYLYGHLEPDNVDIRKMPFDKEVIERYQSFQQMSQSLLRTGMEAPQIGEAMKQAYGDTFYWFYFFCRDVHSY